MKWSFVGLTLEQSFYSKEKSHRRDRYLGRQTKSSTNKQILLWVFLCVRFFLPLCQMVLNFPFSRIFLLVEFSFIQTFWLVDLFDIHRQQLPFPKRVWIKKFKVKLDTKSFPSCLSHVLFRLILVRKKIHSLKRFLFQRLRGKWRKVIFFVTS